jgi:L-threonylcarbamoyladenylate synthase
LITSSTNSALEALKQNEVIAIPTETVYGLAGNAFNEEAIKKIYSLKNRPYHNPLIVHIKSADYMSRIVTNVPAKAKQLAIHFWPGPLTLVLKKQPLIPNIVTAGKDTVAIRVPNHPLTLELLNKLDFPLAAPSANPFGSISPTTAQHVENYFKHTLKLILDGGNCERGIESTIIGFKNDEPILYRLGSLSIEQIELVIGPIQIKTKNEKSPEAPGMLSKHYAPKTPTYLTNNVVELCKTFAGKKIGVLLFKNKIFNANISHQEILSPSGNLNEAAARLYASMHTLDQKKLDVIIAEKLPDRDLGKSLNDRLERASKKLN